MYTIKKEKLNKYITLIIFIIFLSSCKSESINIVNSNVMLAEQKINLGTNEKKIIVEGYLILMIDFDMDVFKLAKEENAKIHYNMVECESNVKMFGWPGVYPNNIGVKSNTNSLALAFHYKKVNLYDFSKQQNELCLTLQLIKPYSSINTIVDNWNFNLESEVIEKIINYDSEGGLIKIWSSEFEPNK